MQEDTVRLPFSMSLRHLTRYGMQICFKIKSCFPPDLYAIIKSYLLQRIFRVKFGEVITLLKDINSGVPQGSVLGPVLYLLYTADLPVVLDTITGTYADGTAILTAHKDYVEASQQLQRSLFHIQIWLKKWRIRVNGAKSVQVTFTTRRKTCPPVILNGVSIPQAESARYLGLHLARRLNWRRHISTKRKQLESN